MLIPQINFTEAGVGSSPILAGVRNRIGIVGQFSRGLANTFQYVDGFSQFSTLYGSDNESGSIAYQAAWDQGARDFGIVRVLGRSRPAKGQVIFGGEASINNNLNLKISGIGTPSLSLGSYLSNTITANGNYTGTESGRYIFVVTNLVIGGTGINGSSTFNVPRASIGASDTANAASDVVGIKYKFVPYSTARDRTEAIASVTQTVLDSIIHEPGVVAEEGFFLLTTAAPLTAPETVFIEKGFSVLFGENGETLEFNTTGDTFTLITEVWDFDIPITQGDTAVEVSNSFVNVLSGADPLGTIDSQLDYVPGNTNVYTSVVDFEFDNDIIPGAEGNNYFYQFDLDTEEPDGQKAISVTYAGGATNLDFVSTDPDAALLQNGDVLSLPTGSVYEGTITGTISGVVEGPVGTYTITISPGGTETNINGGTAVTEESVVYFTPATPSGITISNYQTFNTFSEGVDGPRTAAVDLFTFQGVRLIEFQAISQGQWGNNLRLDIDPLPSGGFTVVVTDLEGENFSPPILPETYTINLTSQGAVDEFGQIEAFKTSDLVRAFFVPKVIDRKNFDTNLLSQFPTRLAPKFSDTVVTDVEDPRHISHFGPSRLNNVSFENGSDGPILTEADYVDAIKALEGQQVHIILAPGIDTNSPSAQAQLVAVANNGTEVDGLKIAILNAQPGLKPSQAATEVALVNSPRAVMVAGWSTYGGQLANEPFNLSPDAVYAGHLATIGFQVSPAAKTTAGPVFNIVDVDTRRFSSQQALQLYTDGRLEVLRPDVNLGGFFFLNGRTTSSNTAWDRIIIRRTYDVIRQDLYEALQPYQSEPHTRLLRRQIETSVNAYFQTLLRNGKIANALPAVCNDSNNPSENYLNGQLNVSVGFLPLYAADYINVRITRNVDGGLQLGDDV